MAVKHRCGFCHKVLREDGTCSDKDCPRYVPEEKQEQEQVEPEDTSESK